MYQINRKTSVNCPIDQVWEFLARPENLDSITPENMRFEILSEVPETMFNGLLIEYRITIPLFGRQRWLTEIKHIREGISFVDEQRIGPYKFWYHYHEVQPKGQETEIIDQVTYQLPFGILGNIVHALIIKGQLKHIFDFRESAFKQLLKKQE